MYNQWPDGCLPRLMEKKTDREESIFAEAEKLSFETLATYILRSLRQSQKKPRGVIGRPTKPILPSVGTPHRVSTYRKLLKLLVEKDQTTENKRKRRTKGSKRKPLKADANQVLLDHVKKKIDQLPDRTSSTKHKEVSGEVEKPRPLIVVDEEKIPILEKLPWRILPEGDWNLETIERHFARLEGRIRWQGTQFDYTRLKQVTNVLRPSYCYIGQDEFEGYVVFGFHRTVKVVLECPIYGNATYVVGRDWEKIAHLTKKEIRLQHANRVKRVIHSKNWVDRIKECLG